ncbi:MAG: hypothetical protein IJB74_10235 [Clostridia bacterium]|nr:hypothetical protein [Clostridia bacterium]
MSFENILEKIFAFDSIFINLLNASISACWLVGGVVLFRLIFRKAPKWLNVVLWAIVAVRLLCPVPIESSFSLVPTAEPLPTELLNIDPHKGVESTTVEIINNPVYSDYVDSSVPVDVESFQWDAVLGGLGWVYGAGAMLLYAVFSYLYVYLKVRQSMKLRDNIYLCDRINTPFIFGIIRPKIFLPSAMDGDDMTYVLAHENAHLKRRDHLWKPLGFLILTVYWFNPVIWLSYVLLCRDIELACDEKVIKEMGADIKKPYSMALINCSVPKRMITACPVAFGETGVKKRIKAVLSYKKPALWLIIVAVITGIVLAVCLATSPKAESNDPENKYMILTEKGTEMFRFDEVIEYSEYFTVHKGKNSYFKATPGNGRSTVLNFLSSLALERLPEMSAEGLTQSGKIEVANSDGNIDVVFCDGFSKMFILSTEGSTLTESTLYAVNAEKAKAFFEEEKYIKQGNIWECNLASSAMGHGWINFYVDELCELTEEPVAEGGRLSPYTSDEHGDGYMWTPEITDAGVGENAVVKFKGVMYGEEVAFTVEIAKVGQNDNLSTYYLVSAEDTVIGSWGNNYEYHLSKPTSVGEENEWYCNPNLSHTAYGSISFSLPTEYKLVSADCSKGKAEIEGKYYHEPDGEKHIRWSPDFSSYLTDESYEITVNALRKGQEVSFNVKVIGQEKKDEMRGRKFKIEPVNCIAVNKGWAYYELHEAEKTDPTDLDKAVSKAILEQNVSGRWLGECPAEGHVIFGTKEKGGIVSVYMIERYSVYGFEDGWFIEQSGHSVPAVMRFEEKDGEYIYLDTEYARDGSEYTKSIKRMFPKIYESRAIHPTEKDNEQMNAQLRSYAKAYLDSIGRTEPIGTYSDLNTVLLTDVGVSVDVSNKLLGLRVNYDTGKIGYFETVEDDVRYIYRTSYFPENNLIAYTKEVYGTGEIKEKIEVDSRTGNVISAFNSPQYSDSFTAEVIMVDVPGNSLGVKPIDEEILKEYGDNIIISPVSIDFRNIHVGAKIRVFYSFSSLRINDSPSPTSTALISELYAVEILDGSGDNPAQVLTDAHTFDAEVLDVSKNGDWLLVTPLDGTAERNSSDKIHVSTVGTDLEGRTDIKKGTKVRIIYDGVIMESYPAQLNDVFAIYLHSELPDNINKVPTTRGYYITGETDTGEKDVLPTDFDIKFSFGSENLGSYYDTYKDVIGKEYQINGDITANFCRMESDEAGRFCEFVEFMNGIYAAHV